MVLYDINYLSFAYPFKNTNMIVSLNYQTLYNFNKTHKYDYAYRSLTTSNLETALAGTPQLMYYRFHPVSWLLARWLVKLEYASPVNIVMERQVIPELLQDALCSRLVKQIDKYLAQPLEVAQAYTKEYDLLRARLGKPGVTGRLAKNLQTVLYPTDTGINL